MTAEIYLCGNDSNVNDRHGNDNNVNSCHGNHNARATNVKKGRNNNEEGLQNSRLNFSSVFRWNISAVLPVLE